MAKSYNHSKERTEKLTFWQRHISEQQASKLSMKRYCEIHHLNQHGFVYWRKQLASSNQLPLVQDSSHKEALFAEVTNTVEVDNNNQVSLQKEFVLYLPRVGYTLGFNRDVDSNILKQLVSLLGQMA